MSLIYKLILVLVCYLGFLTNSISIENKILIKVNNEIITSIDVLNEVKYLNLLNKDLKNFDENKIYEIAKNSLIKNIVKENELKKYFTRLDVDEKYLNDITMKYFDKLNLNSIDELKNLLKRNNLVLEEIQNKITIQILWNNLIFQKFSKNVKIDKKLIKEEISKKETQEEYLISEIVFNLKEKETLEKKLSIIENEIKKNNFSNAAILHSISDTAINGGNVGWVNFNSLSKKIRDQLYKIQVGEITNPIQIPGGFIILKIEEKRENIVNLDVEKEFEKIIKIQTNEQLNQFSNIYYNKIERDINIYEL